MQKICFFILIAFFPFSLFAGCSEKKEAATEEKITVKVESTQPERKEIPAAASSSKNGKKLPKKEEIDELPHKKGVKILKRSEHYTIPESFNEDKIPGHFNKDNNEF